MCLGPFSKICHWGPLSAMGITKCVTGMTIHCSGMLWPGNSWPGLLNTLCFMSLAGLTIYNFLSSISHGPGYLPYNWMPENEDDIKFMQYCAVCKSYKAPRSHHCRKCKRCVLKMDHHCPWINNCVGWGNHAHFVAFLTSATLGCFHSSILLSYTLYKSLYRLHYINYGLPQVHLGLYGTILCVLSLGFAIGVVCAVGMLLFFQFRSVIRNQTGIEDWIVEKANYRLKNSSTGFRFPYNLGIYGNIKQVLNFTCQPVGNGIDWKVAEGCDKYTLTKEQLIQKMEKRDRARLYIVKQPASGYWFPISYGLKTCYHPPCTDEDRIKLNIGDTVLVTRWRKYWLFGEKQLVYEENKQSQRIRGWFPRGSAVELDEVDSSPAILSNKKAN